VLSLEFCKQILNSGKKKYTDQTAKRVREHLYQWAELELENNNEIN